MSLPRGRRTRAADSMRRGVAAVPPSAMPRTAPAANGSPCPTATADTSWALGLGGTASRTTTCAAPSSAIGFAQATQWPPRTTIPPASVRPSSAAARGTSSGSVPSGAGVRLRFPGSSRSTNQAIPSRTGYSRRQTGQPRRPVTMWRPSMRDTDATSHVSSCASTHRRESTSSMNMNLGPLTRAASRARCTGRR